MKIKITGAAIALSLSLVADSNAAIVAVGDVTVTANGNGSTAGSGSSVAHTVDRSGLSATLTDGNLSTVTHEIGFGSARDYLTTNGAGLQPGGTILAYTIAGLTVTNRLDTIAIWNFSQKGIGNPARSAESVDVSVIHAGGTILLGNFALTGFDGTNKVTANLIDVSSSNLLGVTSVSLALHDVGSANNVTGISEVAFQTSVVPEPSSAALLGLGGLALVLRRRK